MERVYPILDTAALARAGLDVPAAMAAALAGGARLVQVRHKRLWAAPDIAALERAATLARDAGAHLVVNDRADIAKLVGAGVHVGQDDLLPEDARRVVGGQALVGHSTHNEEQLRRAGSYPIDHVALGPIFSTASKDRPDPTVGLAELRRLRPLARVPLVAIGGISRVDAAAVWAAGADSVAVIADLMADVATGAQLERRMRELVELAARL